MKTKMILSAVLFSLVSWTQIALAEGTIVGKWKTIDDKTGNPKSIVEITQDGDIFKGKILTLLNPAEPNPLCTECEGDKAKQPIQGMEIMWDFKETKKGEEWGDGRILDPKNGKIYKCKAKLTDNGAKLDVRGYVGFSLLGRTQTWIREP